MDPVEVALFAAVVAVAVVILAALCNAFAFANPSLAPYASADYLVGAMTGWASLPIAAVLLAASVVGWFQVERYSDEIELCHDAAGHWVPEELDEIVAADLGHLRRSRVAIVCTTVFAIMAMVAALVLLSWQLSDMTTEYLVPPTAQW